MMGWKLLLKEKPTEFLIILYRNNKPMKLKEIAEELKTPYPYVVKMSHFFESYGIINVTKIGKFKYVKLTDLGYSLVYHILKIKNLLQ